MPPAAPQPTRMRRSARRSRNALPIREAMPLGQLGVARLDADRGAYAARPNRLRRNDNAAEKRHAAAMQRVGFDRIDLPLRPPAHDQFAGNAENEAADERHRNRHHRIEPQAVPTAARRARGETRLGATGRRWCPSPPRPGRQSLQPAPPARSDSIPAPARMRADAVVFPIRWSIYRSRWSYHCHSRAGEPL